MLFANKKVSYSKFCIIQKFFLQIPHCLSFLLLTVAEDDFFEEKKEKRGNSLFLTKIDFDDAAQFNFN